MATATVHVSVSITEISELQELIEAAAVLLSTLGERGEIKSYDREPARLARSLDVMHEAISRVRSKVK